jgi:hypothetical protein
MVSFYLSVYRIGADVESRPAPPEKTLGEGAKRSDKALLQDVPSAFGRNAQRLPGGAGGFYRRRHENVAGYDVIISL